MKMQNGVQLRILCTTTPYTCCTRDTASKQARSQHAGKHASKHVSKQASRQASNPASKQNNVDEAASNLQLGLIRALHDLHLIQALLLGNVIQALHLCCKLILVLPHSCLPLSLQKTQLLPLLHISDKSLVLLLHF